MKFVHLLKDTFLNSISTFVCKTKANKYYNKILSLKRFLEKKIIHMHVSEKEKHSSGITDTDGNWRLATDG